MLVEMVVRERHLLFLVHRLHTLEGAAGVSAQTLLVRAVRAVRVVGEQAAQMQTELRQTQTQAVEVEGLGLHSPPVTAAPA
jgi:hypothetical protein